MESIQKKDNFFSFGDKYQHVSSSSQLEAALITIIVIKYLDTTTSPTRTYSTSSALPRALANNFSTFLITDTFCWPDRGYSSRSGKEAARCQKFNDIVTGGTPHPEEEPASSESELDGDSNP